jgi:hypothetical protein
MLVSQGQESSAGLKMQGHSNTYILQSKEWASSANLKHQGMTATYFLKSQGWALSASLEHCKIQQPLTSWPAKHKYH